MNNPLKSNNDSMLLFFRQFLYWGWFCYCSNKMPTKTEPKPFQLRLCVRYLETRKARYKHISFMAYIHIGQKHTLGMVFLQNGLFWLSFVIRHILHIYKICIKVTHTHSPISEWQNRTRNVNLWLFYRMSHCYFSCNYVHIFNFHWNP